MGISMVGWWGCASCGQKVSNGHMGPCLTCGGEIRRIVPADAEIDLGIIPPPYRRALAAPGPLRGPPAFGAPSRRVANR
jgi:hypothetical protein